jgi:hypothetical protein
MRFRSRVDVVNRPVRRRKNDSRFGWRTGIRVAKEEQNERRTYEPGESNDDANNERIPGNHR